MNTPFKEIELSSGITQKIEMYWGQEERPLYACLRALKPGIAIKWADRFAPLEAIGVEWALAGALESSLQIQVDPRSEVLRAFHCELQNLISSYHYLYQFFSALRDLVRTEQCLYFRELCLNLMETLTGGRVLPQFLRLGGVEKDLTIGEIRKTKDSLEVIRNEMEVAFAGILKDGLVAQGLSNVLKLGLPTVEQMKAGGALALASGKLVDLRWKDIAVYRNLPSANSEHARLSILPMNGDALSRLHMGIERARFSTTLAFELLEQLKKYPSVTPPAHRTDLSRIEWADIPENKQFVFSVEGGSGPIEAKVSREGVVFSTNSTKLKPFVEAVLVGVHREDLDVAYASLGFDPSQGDLA